jgi:O-palmitoleoyl-L-serine hydrolase
MSMENCAERAATDLGSSKNWGPTYTDVYEGSSLFNTPPFDSFNLVYAMYCDGGSWAGERNVPFNSTFTLHFRGRALLDGLLEKLLEMGLSNASELLYSGCSAGALTAYLHTDYVASVVPSTVKVLGLADAMFSLEHNSFANQSLFPSRLKWLFQTMNVSRSLNRKCVQAYPQNGFKCLFGANVIEYVETPMFVLNSKYDTWQEKAILGLNCDINKCNSSQQAFFVEYGRLMLQRMKAVPVRHAAFLTNCPAHCQTGTGGDWFRRSVQKTSIADAVASWYNYTSDIMAQGGFRDTNASFRWLSECDDKPCDGDVC